MSAIVIPFPRLNDPLHPVNREMISYYEAQGWSQEALDELLEKARSPEHGDHMVTTSSVTNSHARAYV